MRGWLGAGDSRSRDDAVCGVCCTCCMLYLVYAVVGVNSWSWHGEIESNDLTLCSYVMVELRTWKREMSGYGGNHHEKLGLKRISCATLFSIPDIGGTSPDPTCNYTTTRSSKPTQASRIPDCSYRLVLLHLLLISITHLSLSCPQLYHDRRTQSQAITETGGVGRRRYS